MAGAYMKITAGDDSYEFPGERLPLISRRISAVRSSVQANGIDRIECSLSGYFYEEANGLRAEYDKLLAIAKHNRYRFEFHDGDNTIIDTTAYHSDISDPPQWGQYEYNYSIGFYYYQDKKNTLDIVGCSFIPSSGSTYTFAKTPSWSFSNQVARSDPYSKIELPSGTHVGSMIECELSGVIYKDTYAEAEAERLLLIDAFTKDGTLNYGSFSAAVRVGKVVIPEVTPNNFFEYKIPLVYTTANIFEFQSKRSFTRRHDNPIIVEYENCSIPPIVQNRSRDSIGQRITYNISARGASIQEVRSALLNELSLLVFSGGSELPGGTEEWDDTSNRVSLQFTMYYANAQLLNLEE